MNLEFSFACIFSQMIVDLPKIGGEITEIGIEKERGIIEMSGETMIELIQW